jgi:hypothetical protein
MTGARSRQRKKEIRMANGSTLSLPEMEDRIAILRDNIRQLTEQAAALSGAGDEARAADRIAEQQAALDALVAERDAILARRAELAKAAAPAKPAAKKKAPKKKAAAKKKSAPKKKAPKKKPAKGKPAKKKLAKKAAKKKAAKKKRK